MIFLTEELGKHRKGEQVLTFTACIAPMADCWSENTANANGCNHTKKKEKKKKTVRKSMHANQ